MSLLSYRCDRYTGMSKKQKPKQCGTVSLSPLIAVIGIIGLLFFTGLLIAGIVTKAGTGLLIICGLFCLPPLLLVLTLNQRIDYTPQGFVYRDMLRISHHYKYTQITKIRYSKDVWIHVGHRIILIDDMAENGKKFARIAAQYAPKAAFVTDSQLKLFGGNVKNPGEFVLVYTVIGLMPICLAVWALCTIHEVGMEQLTVETQQVVSYDFDMESENDDSKRLRIELENGNSFYTWQMEDAYTDFQQDVQDGKLFTAYYLPEDMTDDGIYGLYQLDCEETCYLSLEAHNAYMRETRDDLLLISGVILLFWLVYVVVSTHVMRHAEKYPRLIKGFVKSDYIVQKHKRKVH